MKNMICVECGKDKPEEKFRAFKAKDGMRRMKICNTCRSRRDHPRKELMKYTNLELLHVLEARGLKVCFA